MRKINNYCFKCLSTELLLLGGSDIFCSVCHLVFQDSETLNDLEFHTDSPIDKKYYNLGSWNFNNMLIVFYGWLVRIHKVLNINTFYVEAEFSEFDEDFENKTVIKTTQCGINTFDGVIENLFINTRHGQNEEKYDFLDVSRNPNNENYREIKLTVYCKLKANNIRYNLADFTIIQENYKDNDLYFETWNLLTVNEDAYFEGSYRDLKRAVNYHYN